MKEYELYLEYYDTCSPKPQTSVDEIETDNIDAYMSRFIPANAQVNRIDNPNGDIVYEVVSSGILKRYTFTEI